jgi:hypothetical protein
LFLNSYQYLIPEPSSYALAGVGMLAVSFLGYRRRRNVIGRPA